MDKLFPIEWTVNSDGWSRFILYTAVIIAVNCLMLAAYVFTACFVIWLWFGGWL